MIQMNDQISKVVYSQIDIPFLVVQLQFDPNLTHDMIFKNIYKK